MSLEGDHLYFVNERPSQLSKERWLIDLLIINAQQKRLLELPSLTLGQF